MTQKLSIISTRTATIKGKKVVVEQTKGKGRQDINYLVDGKFTSSNKFWNLKPQFKN